MTLFRLGYVAMSMELKNSSPSQTMTYAQFEKIANREGAKRKLERIAQANLKNCLRLLKHNAAHDIRFFRFSSRIIPLANHEALEEWDFMAPLTSQLNEIGEFVSRNNMRTGFHPDHFVLLNSPKKEILKASLQNLQLHYDLLKKMGNGTKHKCVIHVGGSYKNKEIALERFVEHWAFVPRHIQEMIILENDDKTFNLQNTLYLCEKLNIPCVFDYHHHLANHEEENWVDYWPRITSTWEGSPLPVKMHISSPRGQEEFRAHNDFIDLEMFLSFLKEVNGSVPQIDCMIEAKQKDRALFRLIKEIGEREGVTLVDNASFKIS